MKKLIIAALITACTTSTFSKNADLGNAPNDYAMIIGKKITISDTRKTLIQKFGTPKFNSASNSTWELPNNVLISANYDNGLLSVSEVTAIGSKSINNYMTIDGKKIYLGKDTINTAIAKIKLGCFEKLDGSQVSSYFMYSDAQGDGNYYTASISSVGEPNINSLKKEKISSFSFGYGVDKSSAKCNY